MRRRVSQRVTDLPADVEHDLMEYLDLDPEDQPATQKTLGNFISRIQYRYGLTAIQFVEIYRYQQRQCPICGIRPAKDLSTEARRSNNFEIDHDHNRPKELRGITCRTCNGAIEYFDKHRDKFQAYLLNPPAKQLGLNFPVREFRRDGFFPTSPNTIKRCQAMLERGVTFKEISRLEKLPHATLSKAFRENRLKVPEATRRIIRMQREAAGSWQKISEQTGLPPNLLQSLSRRGLLAENQTSSVSGL